MSISSSTQVIWKDGEFGLSLKPRVPATNPSESIGAEISRFTENHHRKEFEQLSLGMHLTMVNGKSVLYCLFEEIVSLISSLPKPISFTFLDQKSMGPLNSCSSYEIFWNEGSLGFTFKKKSDGMIRVNRTLEPELRSSDSSIDISSINVGDRLASVAGTFVFGMDTKKIAQLMVLSAKPVSLRFVEDGYATDPTRSVSGRGSTSSEEDIHESPTRRRQFKSKSIDDPEQPTPSGMKSPTKSISVLSKAVRLIHRPARTEPLSGSPSSFVHM